LHSRFVSVLCLCYSLGIILGIIARGELTAKEMILFSQRMWCVMYVSLISKYRYTPPQAKHAHTALLLQTETLIVLLFWE